MDPLFMLYAMEQEGELETKESKINKAIKLLRLSTSPIDECELYSTLDSVGLRPGDVSSYDIDRIKREVTP